MARKTTPVQPEDLLAFGGHWGGAVFLRNTAPGRPSIGKALHFGTY